jgi:UDP-glucose 4-epimerase
MILVTGGLGFVGQHVTRALLEAGESCVLVQRRDPVLPDDLAGTRTAIGGLLNVVQAACDWQVARVGIASTIGVYGGVTAVPPYREDVALPVASGHVIPAFKKIGEVLAGHLADATGIEILSYRISPWGPGGNPASPFTAAPQLVHAAARGIAPDFSALPSPPRAGDGFDMCYVKDCARAIALLQLAPQLNHRTYNIASGTVLTNAEVAAAVRGAVPSARFDLPEGRGPASPGPPVCLDISRLRADTGYQPAYDTGRAVADYIAWLRAGHKR